MKPNWKNTLHNEKRNIDGIHELANMAFKLDYDFMLWSDRIYKVYFEHPMVTWSLTELTIDDIDNIVNVVNVVETQNVVVACRAADGCPALVIFEVEYTEEEYNLGVHYDRAIELAEANGYEAPFICFDENEQSEISIAAKILDN